MDEPLNHVAMRKRAREMVKQNTVFELYRAGEWMLHLIDRVEQLECEIEDANHTLTIAGIIGEGDMLVGTRVQLLAHQRDKARKTVPASDPRIKGALELAIRYGQIDGGDHKMWVIDQMVRQLTGDDYDRVISEANAGKDGPDTYAWDTGIAP